MVFVTATIAIGLTIVGVASATGLTSWLLCGERKTLNQKSKLGIKNGEPTTQTHYVHPDDPYYFTEPIVRPETMPFLSKEAQKRHGYVGDERM